MKYRKFNKYEKKEVRKEILANALHGEGLYLFRNNSGGDLTLPRPTKSGIRIVDKGKEFQGDNYYMQFVKTGLLRLVKELQSPESEQNQELQELNEANTNMSDKLILDQPDTVTQHGKIEHVVDSNGAPAQKLNERNDESKPDVLLNEQPDGFVIVG